MKKYRKVYISPGEFEYNKSKGILYEGFVIGVGYAYIRFITPTVKRLLYANPACYYFDTIKVQELDISEETIILSFPPLASEPSSKGKIRFIPSFDSCRNRVLDKRKYQHFNKCGKIRNP